MNRKSLLFTIILFLSVEVTFAQTVVNFSQENGVQNWTVPAGITSATITVAGAAGGGAARQGSGGSGASVTGICTLTPGDNLSIVIGSLGLGNQASWGSGGGGSSYIYDSNTITLLIAAGGGGGGGTPASNSKGGAGGINILTNAATAGQGADGADGNNGNGGSPDSTSSDAAGGAGWISNGGNGFAGADGGNDRVNLFTGGTGAGSNTFPNGGGYAGGGGGGNDGGGGGYNGGGGGSPGSGGGGGGSYLNGTVAGTPIANNTGNGYVSIQYGSATGINNLTSNPGTIRIYPNPSNGMFTVGVRNKEQGISEIQIEIYNMLGEQVYTEMLKQVQHDNQINISNQPNGVYFYRVFSNNGNLIGEGKLVIAN